MSLSDAAPYLAWNERVVRFWLLKPTSAAETYLTVTPTGLALAVWECDGKQITPQDAETDLVAAVRAGYLRWVLKERGNVRSLNRKAPGGDAPLGLAFLAASVLAAHRMRASEGAGANAYYARLAQVLSVSVTRGLPQGLSTEGFEALWLAARNWTLKHAPKPLFIPKTTVVQKYVAYPLAHAELREVDLEKLPEFFDWAGYSPSASIALPSLREDFSRWAVERGRLSAPGRAACEDARVDGVIQQVAQELSAWDGMAEDNSGRRVANIELTLDIVRGAPRLFYLARRPPGFPEAFEHEGHRFDSLEAGWYAPLPVPSEHGAMLLHGFDWSSETPAPTSFVLRRRASRAIALVRNEQYSGLTSRRRLLAGVECAVLYHDSVAEVVETRLKQLVDSPCRPMRDPSLPEGWRVYPNLNIGPNGDAIPELEALEVDAAIEVMTSGGLRVGRRATWLIECPPRLIVSGLTNDVVIDGRPASVSLDGQVDWSRASREPGEHVVEAGRAHLRFELVEASVADGLASLLQPLAVDRYSVALTRGRWEVVGSRPGQILEVVLPAPKNISLTFAPVWAIPTLAAGCVLYVGVDDQDVGPRLDDSGTVAAWVDAICRAYEAEMQVATIAPENCSIARRSWNNFTRIARRERLSEGTLA